MEGQRLIADFFHMLDYFVEAVGASDCAGDYKLQQLGDCCPLAPVLAHPPIERSTPGNIVPGKYIIGKFPWAINILILTPFQRL